MASAYQYKELRKDIGNAEKPCERNPCQYNKILKKYSIILTHKVIKKYP